MNREKKNNDLHAIEQVFKQYFPPHDNLNNVSADDRLSSSGFATAEHSEVSRLEETCIDDSHAGLISLAGFLQNEEHRDFLLSRIEDVTRNATGSELYYLALSDLRDELLMLEKSVPATEASGLHRVAAAILDMMSSEGYEVIELKEWNPEFQRALRVEYSLLAGAEPRVLSQVSSGLSYHGKLLRKQAVVLQKEKIIQ